MASRIHIPKELAAKLRRMVELCAKHDIKLPREARQAVQRWAHWSRFPHDNPWRLLDVVEGGLPHATRKDEREAMPMMALAMGKVLMKLPDPVTLHERRAMMDKVNRIRARRPQP